MREIVQVQVGQCGNQIGAAFWQTICGEHKINIETGEYQGKKDVELDRIEVYFTEGSSSSRYVPRTVLVDLDAGSLDAVRAGPTGGLFSPDSFVTGSGGTGNNWAKGYYTHGSEVVEPAMDLVRKQVEGCDAIQGFQMCHSLGGGTGSGTGGLLLTKIREEFPDRMILNFSVFPSSNVSDVVVEPYNATLALQDLQNYANEVVVLDNQALYETCMNAVGVSAPSHKDLNELVCSVMSGVTCSLRFPGVLNSDLRKLAVNLIPFPNMHFFLSGFSPFQHKSSLQYNPSNAVELLGQAFSKKCTLCSVDPRKGQYMTASAIFRGDFSTQEVETEMVKIRQRDASAFVDWVPNNIMSTVCSVPPVGIKKSVTCLTNSTAIKSVFAKLSKQTTKMFKNKAYIHWYTQEGMDETDFEQSLSSVNQLVSEYEAYEGLKAKYFDVDEPEAELETGDVS